MKQLRFARWNKLVVFSLVIGIFALAVLLYELFIATPASSKADLLLVPPYGSTVPVITLTDSGFSPDELTVVAGMSVNIVNNSSTSYTLIGDGTLREITALYLPVVQKAGGVTQEPPASNNQAAAQPSGTPPEAIPTNTCQFQVPFPAGSTYTHAYTYAGDCHLSLHLAVFTSDVTVQHSFGPATLTGRVLDTTNAVLGAEQPIVGAVVSLLHTGFSAVTDSQGYFTLSNLTATGEQVLDIDTTNAQPAPDGSPYAGFREKIVIIAGITNGVDRPFYLPRIDPDSLTPVDPAAATNVENPNLEILMAVPAYTALDEDGSYFTGDLSISDVPLGLAPAALPENLSPGRLITIQPVGVTFDTPVPITFPNEEGLEPGNELDLWSLDPESGSFVVVGTGRVSEDGSVIETIEGGIRAADWHLFLPPATEGGSSENGDNNNPCKESGSNFGSQLSFHDGCLGTNFSLPAYTSLEENHALTFVYKSDRAYPTLTIPFNTTIPVRSAVPDLLSYQLSINSIEMGNEIFVDTDELDEGSDETIHASIGVDASYLTTGVYPYNLKLTNHYQNSQVSTNLLDKAIVLNVQNSSLGVGWGVASLQQIYPQFDGTVLVTDGNGSAQLFEKSADAFFQTANQFSVTSSPKGTIAGDFNNDGDVDLAVSHQDNSIISILLGDGKNGFYRVNNLTVGSNPQYFATDDFNKDGDLDLVVANWASNNISVLIGNGNGDFAPPVNLSTGTNPQFITTGDFNSDDNGDLAISNVNSDNISLFLGDGNGGFSPPTNFAVSNVPRSIVAGNFNADSWLDIAIVHSEVIGRVSVLFGNGSGGFSAPTTFAVGSDPWFLTTDDFNEDGYLDLVTSNTDSNTVSIILGDGNGGFSAPTDFAVGEVPTFITTEDFNRDGDIDIVVANAQSDDISVLFGNGSGEFSSLGRFTVGQAPYALSVGNFDEDQYLDLAVANLTSNNVFILTGDGGRGFSSPTSLGTGLLPVFVLAEDFNGDDNSDIVVTNFDSDSISVFLRESNGRFSNPVTYNVGDSPKFIVSGDFDNNGTLDLAILNTNSDNVFILSGNGAGGFEVLTSFAVGNQPDSIANADFDGNGSLDLVVSNELSDAISIWLGDGDGTFTFLSNIAVGNEPEYIAVADFNKDGKIDLAVANRSSDTLSILLGNGGGGFGTPTHYSVGNGPDNIGIGDFNTDGNLDLANVNEVSNDVSILFGNQNGTFSEVINLPVGGGPDSIIVVDLDGNGTQDIVTTNIDSDNVSILLGNGSGTFATPIDMTVGDNPLYATVADFDNNQTLDLAVANEQSNTVSVLFGKINYVTELESPNGNFSTLIQNEDGSFVRIYKDGTEYQFNAAGLQTAVSDPNGNTTSYEHDENGRLITITDPVGFVTSLSYSGNLLHSVTDPVGRTTLFTHDADGNLITVTFPDGSSRSFAYDNRHLMTSETDERGYTTTRTYNEYGQVVAATLPDGTLRQTSAGQLAGIPPAGQGTAENPAPVVRPEEAISSLTDGENHTTMYLTGAFGEATQVVDPAGFTTTIERDADGNPTQTTLPSGAVFNRTFDDQGNLLAITDLTVNGTTSFTYDNTFNQVTSITDDFNHTTTLGYDAFGNLTHVTTPLNRTVTVAYNNLGLPTSLVDPLGTQTTFAYDANGRLTQTAVGEGATQRVAALTYTPAGYIATLTDPLTRQSSFTYDVLGRLTSETLPGDRTITYQYDAAGNLTALTPPGRPAHTFGYNQLGLVTAYIPPVVAGSGSNQTLYSYNHAQELTQIARPDGVNVLFGYDENGRLQTITLPRGPLTYGYSPTTGQLTTLAAPGDVNLTYSYNDELLTQVAWSGAVAGTVGFGYDASYRLISTSVNGSPISYQYDADDALTQAGSLAFTYHPTTGLLTNGTLGSVSSSWGYNEFAELTSHTTAYNSSNLYATTYERDKIGRITSKTETIGGVTTIYTYLYDAAGRLNQVQENGLPVATYTYDPNGNRLSYTDASNTTLTASYDDQDRLLQYGDTSYTYTANGELLTQTTAGQTTTYIYDELGNLLGVSLPDGRQITYLVDGQNRRIGKQVDGTLTHSFLYQDDLKPIAELDGSGIVISRFVYGNQVNVPEYLIRGGSTYRLITDHLGSVRLVVDTQTGAIAQRLDYDAWGQVTQDTNPGFQPFGFAGGLYDPDTGLVRFGARDYAAQIGRWTAKDPIGFASGDTNLYAYVTNSPLHLIDSQGTTCECPQSPPANDPKWKPYSGDSSWFHCGYTGFHENRTPTPDDPIAECFYDDSGKLVDDSHKYPGCQGTPNQYPSNTWDHVWNDSGGIRKNNGDAFNDSRRKNIDDFVGSVNDWVSSIND